jgi:hypothetical protein
LTGCITLPHGVRYIPVSADIRGQEGRSEQKWYTTPVFSCRCQQIAKCLGMDISGVSRRLLVQKQHFNIYFKNSIRYVRKEKEGNVQNINSILSDLS